jgi:protocatechuate 3,4-dioxygenase beta subunit
MTGDRLTLRGHVLTRECSPVAGARLDFWQADASGAYDNSGYRLRGHLASAADSSFTLETIVPGLYAGRTQHIHVKVSAPGKASLTTQLFLPGVAQNGTDSTFDPALVVKMSDSPVGKTATFDFVLANS